MPLLVNDAELEQELIADRRSRGIDQFDEVWDGVYIIAPLADDEHQDLVGGFTMVLGLLLKLTGLGDVRPGVNISNSRKDWTRNYRVPDVLVFLKGTTAENRHTHWFGGPDFAVEIVSTDDHTREKFPFYVSVGVKELLVIDRNPWQLELLRLTEGGLKSVAVGTVSDAVLIECQTVPIALKLVAGVNRPGILVRSFDGQVWTI